MKKFTNIIYSKLWIVIPVLIVLFWAIIGILQVFKEDRGITVISHPTQAAQVKNKNESKLTFKAKEEKLGIVSLNLRSINTSESGTTTFQIKELGAYNFYHQKKYSNRLIASTNPFPFGFEPIKNSEGKTYEIRILADKGSYDVNDTYLKYQFDKKSLISNKIDLISFLIKKTFHAFSYLNVVPIIVVAIVVSIIIRLLTRSNQKNEGLLSKLRKTPLNVKIIGVIIIGLSIRLMLATGSYNFDVVQWLQIGSVSREHINIYSYNQYYNYSPLWFGVLAGLDRLQIFIKVLPFEFIVRAFLSFVDVVIFFVIMKIAKNRKLPELTTASLFFLNPVSMIISGHHGQFDNFAILFFLLGIYYFEKKDIKSSLKKKLVFMFLTVSLLLKHVVIFQVLYFFINSQKSKIKGILLFFAACTMFMLTLLPFLSSSSGQIIKRVFLYGGVQGLYGFSFFLCNITGGCTGAVVSIVDIYKVIFLIAYLLFVIFIRHKDIIRGTLLTILFFLVFTSGIGAQYFLIPIAFGVFFPTRWFYFYTIVTTLFFLGSADELNLYTFKVFEWNTVWLAVILWFIAELTIISKPLQKARKLMLG